MIRRLIGESRNATKLLLPMVTVAALAIHGYHLGTDDAAIYIPAIKKAADVRLYPFGSEFFLKHASLSGFSKLVGWPSHWLHLPIDLTIFIWYLACLLLLFIAARKLLCLCFENETARWGGVAMLACLLTVPVAGTALILMDPYLTARSLSTPLSLFTIACFLERRYGQAAAWLLCTALIHPQMAIYAAIFAACLAMARRPSRAEAPSRVPALATLSVTLWFEPAQGPYHEILQSRGYFLVSNWQWYEWLGVVAPVLILFSISRSTLRGKLPAAEHAMRALGILGVACTAAALVLASSPRFDYFTRMQPMRGFHLIYVFLFLLVGALTGQYILKTSAWKWSLFFVLLGGSMTVAQVRDYPSSPHIEWPGSEYRSDWLRAFSWIRLNTPVQDIFALDPNYMLLPGVDLHGFRALAERSQVADIAKDSGPVSVFPELADTWKEQTLALAKWRNFTSRDFRTLRARYGVDWIVIQKPMKAAGFMCPYQNDSVQVCRVTGTSQ